MSKIIYLYVFDTMADWEPSFVTAELNTGRFFKQEAMKYVVKTIGLNHEPVVTMGGLRILPDLAIEDFALEDAAALILPGGETWLEPMHEPILEKAKACLNADITVAAICGATMALAQAGFLNDREHTSNDLAYLKSVCPNYTGEAFYRQQPAVTDGRLITASGAAPIDFAYHILRNLDVFSEEALEAWHQLFLTRDPKYFYTLMTSNAPLS